MNSLNPYWDQELKASTVGQGKIVFNVMSSHVLYGDTFVGQVSLIAILSYLMQIYVFTYLLQLTCVYIP